MKISVGILGATGFVGQKFVELLMEHPWFTITALAASQNSCGKRYAEAIEWKGKKPLTEKIAQLKLSGCAPNLPCRLVFSALDSVIAEEVELEFANQGYCVVSNSRSHRMKADVPLVIPEVNGSHLELVKQQPMYQAGGMIVTNPNCSVVGLSLALKPLLDRWGIEMAHVVTMQALSGAGQAGVSGMPDNVIPYIDGEEEKVEKEPLKILGSLGARSIVPHDLRLSAQCNRVAVSDGHMACVSIKLKQQATAQQIIEAWNSFSALPQELQLPLSPKQPLIYFDNPAFPQPKVHRDLNQGMAVSIGRLRPCSLFDWKFSLLSHNMVRGAAGCAILNAELLFKLNYIN